MTINLSSSAMAERPRDARCFMCTSLEEAWSTSYRWLNFL